jgi:hypothetical protein
MVLLMFQTAVSIDSITLVPHFHREVVDLLVRERPGETDTGMGIG